MRLDPVGGLLKESSAPCGALFSFFNKKCN